MTGSLSGLQVLVTGAAGGLGQAIARAALADGAAAVLLGDTDDAALGEAVRQLSREYQGVRAVELDVTSAGSWSDAVQFAESTVGGLDVLVNNAGVTAREGIVDLDPADWDRVIAVNQTGVFLGMRASTPLLERSEAGSIVNVASIASFTGYKAVAYTASKWAVRGLTQAAATELGARGIRVNSVSPGFVATPLTKDAAAVVDAFSDSTPLSRACVPAEVAEAVVFLASDRARYVTGTDLLVDGGWSAGATRFVTG